MKKIGIGIFGIISLFMLITACGGTPKAASPDELDTAIRDASDYLNVNIPEKSKIVILNVQSDSTALSDYIIDELIANAVNDRLFEVVDRQQLDLIRAEQNFQFSGEVSDQTALDIGKFLGAQIIVSGRVSQVSDRYRFTIRALEVQTARVVGQNNINIAAGKTITSLMRSGSGSGGTATTSASGGRTQTGTASSGAATSATPATQAVTSARATAPQNGTYAFWPRPQATRAGTPVKAYLDQVVVRGGYIIFYLYGQPSGKSGDPEGDNWWYLTGDHVILQDLDNPRLSWEGLDRGHLEPNGKTLTFQGVTGKRFSLTNTRDIVPVVFEEIDLNKSEFEP
jgi:TolB-like protein